MKIFSAKDIKEIRKLTMEREPIAAGDLIERASSAVACEVISRWLPNKRMVVFAGPGDNGAMALCVARMLIEQGYHVETFLFNIKGDSLSAECIAKKEKLQALGEVDFSEITSIFNPPYLSKEDIVIDGLFGIGLNEPLNGGYSSVVRYINESGAHIVSIDMPSGLYCNWNSANDRHNIIQANLTLTFQFPKLSFFFAENKDFVGEWKVLDIELNEDAIKAIHSKCYLVEKKDVAMTLTKRNPFSNKYDFGSALIVAGSYGMMGAAILSAKAAMRSGCGLVTVHSPRCGMQAMQTAIPEVLFSADKNDIVTTSIEPRHKYNIIALGPGMGTHLLTVDAFEKFLINYKDAVILDADALNCIHVRPSLLSNIPMLSIITPHAKEFDRLFGEFYLDEMRLKKAIEISHFYNIFVVLKGHNTITVFPDGKIYVNSTGNVGMATAGSGDVLTGVITSLVAQGYNKEVSAVIGTYIHGYAGDLAAKKLGTYGLMASDIINELPIAIKEISNQ